MNEALGLTSLAVAAALVLLSAGLSLLLQMGIARSLLVAAVRTVVQLRLVGLALRSVFALQSPWLVGLVMVAMLATASYETLSRQQRRFAGRGHGGRQSAGSRSDADPGRHADADADHCGAVRRHRGPAGRYPDHRR